MRTLSLLVAFTIVPAITTCHAHRTPHAGGASGSTPASASRATVRVENNHWLDVVIYVEHDGQRNRLGTVTAATTADFTLPPTFIGQTGAIQLIARAIGSSGSIATGTIVLRPRSHVAWTLQTDLARSNVSVY